MKTPFRALVSLLFMFALTSAEKTMPIIENGAVAPIFMLPDTDGKRISLRDYCGELRDIRKQGAEKKIVVLSFCASYCIPCRREIPQLESYAKRAPKDVKIIFISVDSLVEQGVLPFVKELNIQQTMLIDRYMLVMKKYGVKKLPSLFIIDKDGTIQFQSLDGFPEGLDLGKALTEKIEEIRQRKTTAAVPVAAGTAIPKEKKLKAIDLLLSRNSLDNIIRETGLSAQEIETVKKEALTVLQNNLN